MALFHTSFQAGPFFEVFSAQGSQPLLNWKTTTRHNVKKVYDRSVRGYVFSCNNGRMQLPRDERKSMLLHQDILVLQIMLVPDRAFSLELGFTDAGNTRRRLILSSSFNEVKVTPLHCQLPIQQLPRGLWLNIALDMAQLVPQLFQGQAYKSMSQLILGPFCRLRRIFTLKELQLHRNGGEFDHSAAHENGANGEGTDDVRDAFDIPRPLDFLPTVQHLAHFFTVPESNATHGGASTGGASARIATSASVSTSVNAEKEQDAGVHAGRGGDLSSMPALQSLHYLNHQHQHHQNDSTGNDATPGSSGRGDTPYSARHRQGAQTKDLPHLAFGRRFAASSTPSQSGGGGVSGGTRRERTAPATSSSTPSIASSAPASEVTSICVRGERGTPHSRSKSSELGRTGGGASAAPSGNGIASTTLGNKNTTLGRDGVLASIISATKINSDTTTGTAGAGAADQLPLTRPIVEKKRGVLGPLSDHISGSSSKPRVQGVSRHSRSLSRSARAVKSSENAVSKMKPSSAVRRSTGGHGSRKSGGVHSSRGSLARVNGVSETSRMGMGASAPTNMMGSLPRSHRRGGAPGLSEDLRLHDVRPISEQGGGGIRASDKRSKGSAKKRGVYDKARYSDSIDSNTDDARGNERNSGDVSESDTVGLTRKSGAATGFGNCTDADDEHNAARLDTSREAAINVGTHENSIPRFFPDQEQSIIAGTRQEPPPAAAATPATSSTRSAGGGGVMPLLPQNKLGSVSAGFDNAHTSATVETNGAFDFHSRPRALSASRTLEPLSLHSAKSSVGVSTRDYRGEAVTTTDKKSNIPEVDMTSTCLRDSGQQQHVHDNVLRWAKKMNRINNSGTRASDDAGGGGGGSEPTMPTNAPSSSMDAWYGVKEGANDVDSDLQNSVANERALFSSEHDQRLRHESVPTKPAGANSASGLGTTREGETKLEEDERYTATTTAASIASDREVATRTMDGVTHESTHQHAPSSFGLSETFSNGTDFAASNFHAAYLSRAFTPPVFLKRDTIAPPTVDGAGDEEYYYNHFPDPPPSSTQNDAASAKAAASTTKNGSGALDLMFDPILNCYFDPKTTLYYELRR